MTVPASKATTRTLGPFANPHRINVVVETPKGCRNKFKFDESLQCFRLGKILPLGASFPYDFGFVPGTRAEDGDPLDVLTKRRLRDALLSRDLWES